MSDYSHPEMLVSTEWVSQHLDDPNVVIAEVDVDTSSYDKDHIPGAVGWNWRNQLCDQLQRDVIQKEALEKLMSDSGISNDTTVVLYGDNNNWFAAWALWQLEMYGHKNVRLMDGGRKKWEAEGRKMSSEKPSPEKTSYTAGEPDPSFRAFLQEVQSTYTAPDIALVDVRSADEFSGKVLSPPGLAETCQRGGHIPGAKNITWSLATQDDGTFKSYDELKQLYEQSGVTPDKNVITYCRIGERSSHSWFVLKHLLGYDRIKNYDGSWTEWGNLVGAPVEKGAMA